MPSRPRSPSSGHSSRGKRLSRSMSAASGAMRSRGKLRHGGAQGVDVFAQTEIEISCIMLVLRCRQACESCPIVRQSDQVSMNRSRLPPITDAPQHAHARRPRAATLSATPLFDPVEREPAYTRVSSAIEAKILSRALRDGDVLPAETRSRAAVPRASLDGARGVAAAGERRARDAPAGREADDREPAARREGRVRHAPRAGAARRDVRGCVGSDDGDRAGSRGARGDAADAGRSGRADAGSEAFRAWPKDDPDAVDVVAEFFEAMGAASRNQVLVLAKQSLTDALAPSLARMIDTRAAGALSASRMRSAGSSPPCETRTRKKRASGCRSTSATSSAVTRSPASRRTRRSRCDDVRLDCPRHRARSRPPSLRRRRCTATRCRACRRALQACTSVVRMRAPVAPIGWPSAHAPPLTLTLAGSSFRSWIAAIATHGERFVDLVQIDLTRVPAGLARAPPESRRPARS